MNLLVADIGGTNARFGFQKNKSSEVTNIEFLECKDFPKIEDAIKFYIASNNLIIKNLSLSVAGPCSKNVVKLTNNHWHFEKRKILKKFGCSSILAINDFAAQGLGFSNFFKARKVSFSSTVLKKHKIIVLKKGIPQEKTNILITGPGTGLGICTLSKIGSELFPIQGEGGNVHFSPANKLEIEILQFLSKKMQYVSTEELLSGRGLENIYKFLLYKHKIKGTKKSAKEIGESALNNNKIAKKAAKIMFEILGTSISNNILINGCQRGVVICGGISSKLQSIILESNFLSAVENKGRYSDYVGMVPIFLSVDDNNGLKGAAEAFHNTFFQDSKEFI